MTEPSQPDTDSSTGTMILGVQCACRVIQWKDGDHSIEPCPLHAHADDLLKALKFCRSVLEANPVEMSERMAIEKASKAIEEAQS